MQGPNGERRKGDAVQVAVQVMRIATGEEEEQLPSKTRNGGLIGGKRRAANLSPERRSEIARKAAQTRWANKGQAA